MASTASSSRLAFSETVVSENMLSCCAPSILRPVTPTLSMRMGLPAAQFSRKSVAAVSRMSRVLLDEFQAGSLGRITLEEPEC